LRQRRGGAPRAFRTAARRPQPDPAHQHRRRAGLRANRPARGGPPSRVALARRVLDGGLRRRPVPAVPGFHERARDLPRRALPARHGQERRPRPGRRHRLAHPRLQLRVPPVLRVRPEVVVPARAAGEPSGSPGRGGRAAVLSAAYDSGVDLPPQALIPDHVRAFLEGPQYATISTVGAGRTPHQAVIWYRLEPDGRVLVNSRSPRRWPDELQRERQASLAIPDREDALRWVGLQTVVEEVVDEVARAREDIVSR